MELVALHQNNKNYTVSQKHEKQNESHEVTAFVYFFTAASADGSSVLDASPELVSLSEEVGKLFSPVLAQCPWKYLILALLLILLHGVCKISRDGTHMAIFGLQLCPQWHNMAHVSSKENLRSKQILAHSAVITSFQRECL